MNKLGWFVGIVAASMLAMAQSCGEKPPSLSCDQAQVIVGALCAMDPASEQCAKAKAEAARICGTPTPTPPPTTTTTTTLPPPPTTTTTTTLTPIPTPTPTPIPTPTPTPPVSNVQWKHTDMPPPEVCTKQRPEQVEFEAAVSKALEGEPAVTQEREREFYTRIAPRLRVQSVGGLVLDVAMYGEELAVANESGRSENWDLLAWAPNLNANRIRFTGGYQSTCKPASYSLPLPGGPAPTPTPTPGPTPTPTPPTSPYPMPVEQIRVKVHVPAAERPDGRAVMDGVALTCDAVCAPRQCCAACGPEGSRQTMTRINREQCDRDLNPRWIGGDPHPTNPWLRFAKPGEVVRACVESVCSDPATGQRRAPPVRRKH